MSSHNNEDLNRLTGKYVQKYGKLFDEWSAMLFYEIQENFGELRSELKESVKVVDKAATAIKGSHKSIRFQDRQQAFYFGLGVVAPASFTASLISILIFWYAYTEQSFQEKRNLIDVYENVADYVLLIKHGQIIEKQGSNYLVLEPSAGKGDIKIGSEYVFDKKNKRVLVPLGRK